MRVVILTSSLYGTASACIPRLLENPRIEIAMIVHSQGVIANRWRNTKLKLRKALRIGPLGAFNGLRMRAWFNEGIDERLNLERLDVLAERHGLRLETTPTINCERTMELFAEADADLGLSLGNTYIARRVFSIPRNGMINIHGEILPDFQGAASVIWQLYEGSLETGYTIHEIDDHIDTGRILYQERIPIDLQPTLKETVNRTCARIAEASSKGLAHFLGNYSELVARARPQVGGRRFTTPTYWQYRRMVKQHRMLYRRQYGPS